MPYGSPSPSYGPVPKEHPRATTILVLGIIGLFCGIASIVALIMGLKARTEIDGSGGSITGRSKVQAGVILGYVGIGLWVLGLVLRLAN